MKRNSRHHGQLINEPEVDDIYFPEVGVNSPTHGDYTLEGRVLKPSIDTALSVIAIHGARADYSKLDNIILPLYNLGVPILGATVSGHGVAGHKGNVNFSLDDNLEEAYEFSRLLEVKDCTAIGLSMGGTTAVRLLERNPDRYKRLVLFYPAVFPDSVYNVPFGTDKFRELASIKGAFLTSSFFDIITKFKGKIMLIKGEYDGLDPYDYGKPNENSVFTTSVDGKEVYSPIPPEVFTEILRMRPDTVFVEVPGADHQFAKWSVNHPQEARDIAQQIYDFITS